MRKLIAKGTGVAALAALTCLAPAAEAATFGVAFATLQAGHDAPSQVSVTSTSFAEAELAQALRAAPDVLAADADDTASPASQSVNIAGAATGIGALWEAFALSELSFTFENTGTSDALFSFFLTGQEIVAAAMLDDPFAETAVAYASIEVQRSDLGLASFEERFADGDSVMGSFVPESLDDVTLSILLLPDEMMTLDIFFDAEVFLAATPVPVGSSGPFLMAAAAMAFGAARRRHRTG